MTILEVRMKKDRKHVRREGSNEKNDRRVVSCIVKEVSVME